MALSDLLGMIFAFGGILRCATRVATTYCASKHLGANSAYQMEPYIHLGVLQAGFFLGVASFCNLLSAVWFPQDLRDAPSTTRSGTLHLALLAVTILSSLLVSTMMRIS